MWTVTIISDETTLTFPRFTEPSKFLNIFHWPQLLINNLPSHSRIKLQRDSYDVSVCILDSNKESMRGLATIQVALHRIRHLQALVFV